MACTAMASGSFAVVTYAWRAFDTERRSAGAPALEALESRLQESRAKVARLEQMRRSVRDEPPAALAAASAPGGYWHAVAELASRSGVQLRTLSPGAAAKGPRAAKADGAAHLLRVEGRADFSEVHAFLMGLSSLPILVVPEAVDIKHDKGALALGATLGIFEMPPVRGELADETSAPGPHAASAQSSRPARDPFAGGETALGTTGPSGRLVGIVRDARRALALFEAASGAGVVTATPGQAVGTDRLVAIDAAGVTLAGGGQTRRVPMSGEGQ
ncbi:hypothetical protein [Trinickia dabaoshanensis]|nr:hypothetical protein [Trinickia dabaoshanensis]